MARACAPVKRERSHFKAERNLCAIPVGAAAEIIQTPDQRVQEEDEKMAGVCCLLRLFVSQRRRDVVLFVLIFSAPKFSGLI